VATNDAGDVLGLQFVGTFSVLSHYAGSLNVDSRPHLFNA